MNAFFMSNLQITTCSNILVSYKKWGRSLEITKEALKEFQVEGSGVAERTLEKTLQDTTDAADEFFDQCQQSNEFGYILCTTLERLALEMIKSLSGITPRIHTINNQVVKLMMSASFATNSKHELMFLKMFGKLEEFDCSNSDIFQLDELPISLKILNCSGAPIYVFPDLPPFLESLDCSNNGNLSRLPVLPSGLKILKCNRTNVDAIPQLPETLEELNCPNTEITDLPELPASLRELYCGLTHITSLPRLPDNLIGLSCVGADQLAHLPKLPKTLNRLFCQDTAIDNLPDLPQSLFAINIENTPAALDKQIIERLKVFQQDDPTRNIRYLPE